MRVRSWAVTGVAAVLAGAAGAAVLITTGAHASNSPSGSATDAAATGAASPSPSVTTPAPALRVVSIVHAAATGAPDALAGVSVTFSAPVASEVLPTLSPAFAGIWTRPTATSAVFTPAGAPLPGQTFTVTVPRGTRDIAGGTLVATSTTSWTTRAASPARLQQLLAEAGYLPLTFTPAASEPATAQGIIDSAYAPVAGSYTWRFTAPAALRALYTGSTSSLLTRGAVMAFESAHGLSPDGSAGPRVWSALSQAVAARTVTTHPYTYVYVTKTRPENLTVFQNGKAVLHTPANTGVAGAATPDGSWAIYARYTSETMTGTNPDGTKYSDPGVPWINYFNGGDAVHGFPRATYGSPQSVGCVELPIPTAKTVYSMLGYGDIVTVAG
jgi:peptidoglycan hydrolase-like protein with peptidoglycan-binding domain